MFDEKGLIIIPDVYSHVKSSDAKFEAVTTVEAKKLVLEREGDLVGHKRIIYAIDKSDKTMEAIRKVTIDFFKESLGFTDDDILFVDRSALHHNAETKEAMKKFVRPIFEDTQHGLAKQVLNIAICEMQGGKGDDAFFNFKACGFELTIELTETFTLTNAQEYFDSLAKKIETKDLT